MKPSANDQVSPFRKAAEELVKWQMATGKFLTAHNGDRAPVIPLHELEREIEAACSQPVAPGPLLELLRDAQEELRLIRMKDSPAVYDPTLRSRIAAALAAPPQVSAPRPTPEELSISFDLLFGKYRILLKGNADELVLLDYEDEIRRRAGKMKGIINER